MTPRIKRVGSVVPGTTAARQSRNVEGGSKPGNARSREMHPGTRRLTSPIELGKLGGREPGHDGSWARSPHGLAVSSTQKSSGLNDASQSLEPIGGRGCGVRSIDDILSFIAELDHYRGALVLLYFLYHAESASKCRMRQSLRPGQKALEHSLERLQRLGLVRYSQRRSFPFTKSYRLTPSGRALVEAPVSAWSAVWLRLTI
jgi:DNA-binding HxlR family transcriptional regulator